MILSKKIYSVSLAFLLSAGHVNYALAQGQNSPDQSVLQLLNQMPFSWKGQVSNVQFHTTGESSLLRKYEIIDNAKPQTTLNLAYFIFENDYTSAQLAEKLIQAKKRGVNVRLLVDYFMSESSKDWLGYLVSQRIDVKRYNPSSEEFRTFLKKDLRIADPEAFIRATAMQDTRKMMDLLMTSDVIMSKMTTLAPLIMAAKSKQPAPNSAVVMGTLMLALEKEDAQLAQQFTKYMVEITYRLHHKMLMGETPKGLEYINGGRNLSDEYHLSPGNPLLVNRNYPFFDAEVSGVIKTGKLQFINEFNEMWNSSKMIERVNTIDGKKVAAFKKSVKEKIDKLNLNLSDFDSDVQKGTIVVPGSLNVNYVENRPFEVQPLKDINMSWKQMISSAKKQVTIVSAYLLLKDLEDEADLSEAIDAALKNNVKVDIYTNSFTTTDMNIVNIAAYKKLEEWQKRFGPNFKIYELDKGKGEGSLHAKIINVDDQIVGVGSANSDPRSLLLDSNNLMVMDFSANQSLAAEFFSAYVNASDVSQSSTLGLKWKELTVEMANEQLKKLQEAGAPELKAIEVPGFDTQL